MQRHTLLSQPDCCWLLIHTDRVISENDAFQCHRSEFLFIPLFCSCASSKRTIRSVRQKVTSVCVRVTHFSHVSLCNHPQQPQQENYFHLLCPFIRRLLGCIEPALKEMAFRAPRFVTGSDAHRSVVRFLSRAVLCFGFRGRLTYLLAVYGDDVIKAAIAITWRVNAVQPRREVTEK